MLNFTKDAVIGNGSPSSSKNESLVGNPNETFPEKIPKKEVGGVVNINPSTNNSNRKPSSFINKNAPVFKPQYMTNPTETSNPNSNVYTITVNNNLNNLNSMSLVDSGKGSMLYQNGYLEYNSQMSQNDSQRSYSRGPYDSLSNYGNS